MAIQRTLTNVLFIATLAASAGYAALSPNSAAAGGEGDKDYDCAKSISNKLSKGSRDKLVAACTAKGVKKVKDMKPVMKQLTADKKLPDGKEATCKSCHDGDANGYKAATADAYKWLDAIISKG